jgi:TonB-linked SusC/RagA family outer membrane protein
MKTKLNGILTLLLALVAQVAFAQQTVTGKVIGPDGDSVVGAVVSIKGTSTFTTTDFDGEYSLIALPENTLVYSYIGYSSVEIIVGNQTNVDVTMKNNSLDTVVIQAYRNTTKKTSNIASTSLSASDIEDRPNASLLQSLQGQVPGLSIQTNSGQPGAAPFVQLRGASSLNGNTQPLYIIDGIPISGDAFTSFNPNDVENITTLIDASATAIYGNRGANGVILITTKGGKFETPLKVSYNATTGYTNFIDTDYNRFDAKGLLRFEKSRSAGLGNTLTDAEIDAYAIDTDWEKIFFQTGTNQQHNISLRSGGKNVTQFTSVSFNETESALAGRTLQRMSLRSNLNGKSDNGKFRFGTTTFVGYSDSRTQGSDGSGSVFFNPIWSANNGLPYLDPNVDISSLLTGGAAFTFRNAPYVNLDAQRFDREEQDELTLQLGGDVAYDITNNLTVRYRLGMELEQENDLDTTSPLSALARIRATSNPEPFEGRTQQNYFRDFRLNSNLNIGWAKKFGEGEEVDKKHDVRVDGYVEYIKAHFESFGFTQVGLDPRTFSPGDGSSFINDNGNTDNVGADATAQKIEAGGFSVFANAAYDFDKKYGVEATIRRDKSFRFIYNEGWGTFFAGALRWNISEEDFLKENETIDLLKLRISYGETGNDRISGGYYGALTNTRQQFATFNGYQDNQTFVPSNTVPVADLRWETVATLNLGIDYSLFDQRLTGSVELYNRVTKDLFADERISLVNTSGAAQKNVGDIRNNGVTLNANYNIIRASKQGDFNLNLFANGTFNDDEVLNLSGTSGRIDAGGQTVLQEGQRINEYFLVPYAGINPANGNLLFTDINGNVTETITNEDRRFTGESLNPKFYGGFGFNASYKNFFAEAQFSYVMGTSFIDSDYDNLLDANFAGNGNLSADLLRAWTPDNRFTDIPSLDANNINPGANSDRFLVDSDFLRLRFAQFGYNLPQTLLENTFLTSGRIFVNGENLLTFSDFRGSDPEQRRVFTFNQFPTGRTISFGIDINF